MTLIYSTYEAKARFSEVIRCKCAKARPSRFLIEESLWLRSAESSVTSRSRRSKSDWMISSDAGSWCDRERRSKRFNQWRVARGPWRGFLAERGE